MEADSMDIDGSSYVRYCDAHQETTQSSKKRSYEDYSADAEVLVQEPQENRRVGGMLLSVYDSMYHFSRIIIGALWGFFRGTVQPELPRQIEAHETDQSGRKRRAVESPRTTRPTSSPPPRKKASPKSRSPPVPGSFPENGPITPPDSRPTSSQDQTKHDTPMAVSQDEEEMPPTQAESEPQPESMPQETERQKADREERERIAALPKYDWYLPIGDERRPTSQKFKVEDYTPPKLAPPLNPLPQPSPASSRSGKPASSPIPNAIYMTPALASSKKKLKLPEDAKPGRSFSASQSQNRKLGASTMSASLRSNKEKDDEMEALIAKAEQAKLDTPESRAVKQHWRERKARQKAIEDAERQRVSKEMAEARKEAEEEQAKITAEERQRMLEELQKEMEDVSLPESSMLEPSTPLEEKRTKQKLIRPLDQEWDEKVTKAMKTKSSSHVVTKTVDGVELTRHDFETLLTEYGRVGQRRGWLNDEIVNGWMAAIVAAKLDNEGYKKTANSTPPFVSYNTNWYTTYEQKKSVEGLKNWSKRKGIQGAKLLKTKKIFFPINTGAHWMLLVISPTERAIEFLDSMGSGHEKNKFVGIAHKWLAMELKDQYNKDEWTVKTSESSLQDNFDDCGVFVCFNALASAKGTFFFELGQSDMSEARRLMAAILLNGGLTGQYQLETR